MPTPDIKKFAGRAFSFYPPILNVECNEWTYVESSWSEIRVRNDKCGLDLWIPRRFIGEVSQIDEPVMIVGLVHELEHKGGMVTPHHRRVVAMPGGAKPPAPHAGSDASLPPRSASMDSPTERRVSFLIMIVLALAVTGAFVTVLLTREGKSGGRIQYQPVEQANLGLTAADDYFSIKRKFGEPAAERWKPNTGERQYLALSYPDLGVTLILMGADRDSVHYIGAKDKNWKSVNSVTLPGGVDSSAILRSLGPF